MLPDDADARARAIGWIFAAIDTVEPPIVERSLAAILKRDKPWYEARLPMPTMRSAVAGWATAGRLGDADWLDGDGSAPAI